MKPSEIIRGGIEEIERRGWCQGTMMDARGRVCASGALVMATPDGNVVVDENTWSAPISMDQLIVARAMLESLTSCVSLPWFNDRETTTQEDVILLMKQAVGELEREGR